VLTTLLDTCVLYPSRQRDFLLSLAAEGMYRPIWSARIMDELVFEKDARLVRRGVSGDEARRRAEHLLAQMRRAFDDAEIMGWEPLEGSYGLPDQNDEHVVAAAVVGGAGAIVTQNLRDFPPDRLPYGLDVIDPAEFAFHTVALDPRTALRAVQEIARRSGRTGPTLSIEDVLHILASRYHMIDAVEVLRRAM
jgi:hypothetical protein